MKSKWLWIALVVVVILALVSFVGVQYWLGRPGVRVAMGDLYVERSGMGYAFNDETGECIGSSMVTVDGKSDGEGVFDGTLSVLGFPITESGTISGDPVMTEAGGGFYYIEYSPQCTHMEVAEGTDRQYPVTHLCDYSYQYCVYPDDPQFLAVLIYDAVEMEWYTVVVADDEEQARERYEWFLENEPSLYD